MKLSTFLTLVPIALIAVLIAVANREPVTFRLLPFSATESVTAFVLPLFLLVFFSFILGVLIGGATVGLRRARIARRQRLAAKHIGTALVLDADKQGGGRAADV